MRDRTPRNRTADDRPRDRKRSAHGAKGKQATLARKRQRDAKRAQQGR